MNKYVKLNIKPDEYSRELYSENGFRITISLAAAGDMTAYPENENRKKLYKKLGIESSKIFMQKQIHSKEIHIVDEFDTIDELEGDGFLSSVSDNILTITVADCIPVVLYDKVNKSFGVYHSGWKGTGIVEEGLDTMIQNYGSKPENIKAFIGPGIGSCCYEADSDRAAYFMENWGQETVVKKDDKYYIDLKKANEIILEKRSVTDITVFTDCTCCTEGMGSFRRQGKEFTRMAVVAGYY